MLIRESGPGGASLPERAADLCRWIVTTHSQTYGDQIRCTVREDGSVVLQGNERVLDEIERALMDFVDEMPTTHQVPVIGTEADSLSDPTDRPIFSYASPLPAEWMTVPI